MAGAVSLGAVVAGAVSAGGGAAIGAGADGVAEGAAGAMTPGVANVFGVGVAVWANAGAAEAIRATVETVARNRVVKLMEVSDPESGIE